ncbi:MAG: ATP-binding cassette domain-containing protein [Magnetococcales bacterium]|nr:ATP-binding cassette domain-containing protein [Magnetococcales bacterium]MBF0156308.1 ATP-binding cassette domain-containing protein [Magnetococcales bacterium]
MTMKIFSGDKSSFSSSWPSGLSMFSLTRYTLVDLILSSMVLNVLALGLPLSMIQIYDRILRYRSEDTLFMLVSGLLIAMTFESVLKFLRSYITILHGARFEHRASRLALRRLLVCPLPDFERDGPGVNLESIHAIQNIKEFYAGEPVLVLLDLPFVLVFLVLLYYLSGVLVVVPIVAFLLFIVFSFWIGSRLRRSAKEKMECDDRRINFIVEVLTGIHTVKAMAMESMMLRRYERLQEQSANGAREISLDGADALNIGAFFSQLTMVSVVSFGALGVIDGNLTVGSLIASSMLASRAIQPLTRAVGSWSRWQTARLGRERLSSLFSLPEEMCVEGEPAEIPKGSLRLDGVSFSHGADLPPVLRDLSVEFLPGERVAIGGRPGSGKSTLLWVLAGLLSPDQGRVLLGGSPLAEVDRSRLRSAIAYVPRETELIRGTILENIHLFRPGLEEGAHAVGVAVGLGEHAAKLPQGFRTVLGGGVEGNLPHGLKQRIGVARALVGSPKVLLLDEIGDGIDRAGMEHLARALSAVGADTLLVMVSRHRELLRLADRHFTLCDGRLIVCAAPVEGVE